MRTKQTNIAIALSFVGLMFFAIGFALGINSFLIPVLRQSLELSSGMSYLVLGVTFSAFLILGYPASKLIAAIGYARTMVVSFVLFGIAFLLFAYSSVITSLAMFLVASFLSGCANTILQAAVNPYVTILGDIRSAAKRMSIMGICNKFAWPIAPLFLAYIVGKSTDAISSSAELVFPFIAIAGIFFVLGILSMFTSLPEVKAKGEDESNVHDCPYAANKTSILQFPHLLLGALTMFLYVGVETVALSTLVDYAAELGLPNPENYAWISGVGMIAGYICGILFIPKFLSQDMAMRVCSWLGIIGSLLIVLTPATISIWFILFMALGCSLIWPAIWPLAITDLGRFTKTGSSFMVMAIAGGAIIPLIYGFIKDAVGAQNAYWICLPCFVAILLYGTYGYKIRTN